MHGHLFVSRTETESPHEQEENSKKKEFFSGPFLWRKAYQRCTEKTCRLQTEVVVHVEKNPPRPSLSLSLYKKLPLFMFLTPFSFFFLIPVFASCPATRKETRNFSASRRCRHPYTSHEVSFLLLSLKSFPSSRGFNCKDRKTLLFYARVLCNPSIRLFFSLGFNRPAWCTYRRDTSIVFVYRLWKRVLVVLSHGKQRGCTI